MSTIGEMIDRCESLRVYCEARNCNKGADVDLVALAVRLGREHGAMHEDLKAKFRCSKCGSRRVSFRLSGNVPKVHTNWHAAGAGGPIWDEKPGKS